MNTLYTFVIRNSEGKEETRGELIFPGWVGRGRKEAVRAARMKKKAQGRLLDFPSSPAVSQQVHVYVKGQRKWGEIG